MAARTGESGKIIIEKIRDGKIPVFNLNDDDVLAGARAGDGGHPPVRDNGPAAAERDPNDP